MIDWIIYRNLAILVANCDSKLGLHMKNSSDRHCSKFQHYDEYKIEVMTAAVANTCKVWKFKCWFSSYVICPENYRSIATHIDNYNNDQKAFRHIKFCSLCKCTLTKILQEYTKMA